MAWKEYCAEYWLKELQESMDRCRNISEIMLKMALNTVQSIKQSWLLGRELWGPDVDSMGLFIDHLLGASAGVSHEKQNGAKLVQVVWTCLSIDV